jgi:hypothetical protein
MWLTGRTQLVCERIAGWQSGRLADVTEQAGDAHRGALRRAVTASGEISPRERIVRDLSLDAGGPHGRFKLGCSPADQVFALLPYLVVVVAPRR